MKMTKKVLSILLSLMLVLGTVAAGGMSASALDGEAWLEIGDDTAIENGEIMQSEGVGWSITETENGVTLNLNNPDLTYNGDCISARYLDLTITGSAKLTATGTTSDAICVYEGNLTLNGDFTLRAQKDTGSAFSVRGNLTVEGGSLSIINTGNQKAINVGGSMTVNGGSVYAKTESSSNVAISANNGITLNNGEAFALGDEYAKEVLIKVPGQPPYITGDIIEYGTYPQSGVTDEATVAALNEKLKDDGWVSYGYYSGTNTWDDGQMTPGDWMKYQDVVYEGTKYRAVLFEHYRPYVTGYSYWPANSNQDENDYETETTYWFKFEPVEWKVLDSDSGLIVCNSAIDSQAYNNYILSADGEYYGNAEKTYRANDYANSSIRAWLNNDFINTAFSSSQQENIKVTELDNSCPYNSNYDSATTSDKIFLLSYNEVTNSAYGFNSDAKSSDTARQRTSSDYAKCQGIDKNSAGNSYWWLRSPYDYSSLACDGNYNGNAGYSDSVTGTFIGVVPALKLQNLESDPTGVPFLSDAEITVSTDRLYYEFGDEITVTVTIPADATRSEGSAGMIILKLNGFEIDKADPENGVLEYSVPIPSIGVYTVTAVFEGDDKYNGAEAETTFTVNRHTTQIYLEYADTYSGDTQEIRITLDSPLATGYVIVSLNGSEYTVPLENGLAKFTTPPLPAGNYEFTADYPGDDNHTAAQESGSIKVSPYTTGMTVTVDPETPVYGDTVTATANLPEDAEGTVDFSIDDSDTYTSVTVENGKAVYEIKGLTAGEHTVEAVFANDNKYADETKTVTFNVAQKALTITAEDQTYLFNNQMQGEGDTIYEDSAVIKEKVAVDGLVEGDALTSITLDGAEKEIGVYEGKIVPSAAVIGDKTANYNISYTAGKLTIASVSCPLTINYVYAEGGEAAETHEEDVAIFSSYSVTSPEITGYTPDPAVVTGTMGDADINGKEVTVTYTANTYKLTWVIDSENYKNETVTFGSNITAPEVDERAGYDFAWVDEIPETMPAEDITINGKYTAIEYTATFVDENGKTVDTRTFTVLTESIDEPAVPEKEGYEGKWSEYTIAAGDMEITAEYTPIEYTATFIADGVTVDTRIFTVKTESIDEPAVPEKEGFTGEWEEYELTPGDITVNAVYTEVIPEDLCPLDNEDHGDGFIGRVLTFIHTLIWKTFRLLGLNVFFKVD